MKLSKSSKKISFIFIMLVISLTLFLVNKNINVKAEENQNASSIISWVLENDLPDGNYNVTVKGSTDGGKTEETITYPVELINYYDDVTYNSTDGENGVVELGDDTAEYKMLIVKYHKNLTINEGVTLTANTHTTTINSANYELTYKKGMYIHVSGTLTNNGTISMTARGTYNQKGENVYLLKNSNGIFEYVPAIGGTGATSETYYSTGAERDVPGKSGTNGINRQTGGGGSGSLDQGDTSYKFYAVSGAGASGTSYSGGSGGGGFSVNYRNGTHKANSASPNGGAGGNGYGLRYSSSWATRYASGGAGNPGGIGASNGNGNDQSYNGQTGTGGLLVIYSKNIINNGMINSNGSESTTGTYATGGSSGGGSINIFYAKNITSGSILTNGGAAISTTTGVTGGAGGNGTFNITKLGNPELSDIKINGTSIEDFNSSNTNYSIILDKYSSEFDVDTTSESSLASITGTGKYEIDYGETKTIQIILTSDRGFINIYTLTISNPTIEEKNTKLKSLKIQNYENEIQFHPLINEYTLEIPYTVIDLNIETETIDENSIVKIEGNKYIKNNSGVITITVSNSYTEDTIYKINYKKVVPQSEYDFDSTDDEQTFTVPITGKYKLETWGAQGGDAYMSGPIGGYGGYSEGNIILNKNDKIYINVGGSGETSTSIAAGTKSLGGYNGGGSGVSTGGKYGSGGGGATHIATQSGLLSTLENKKESILIVSGGGGAGFAHQYSSLNTIGGSGGGYKGSGTNGGSQLSGGSNSVGGDDSSFGQGGSNSGDGSAGGSGYYGGGNCSDSVSCGGGSGYIGNPLLTNKVMYCYNCEELNEEDTKTISTTNVSEDPISKYAKQGNGYAKITPILISNDNYLSELTSDYGELSPSFDPLVEEYTLTLDKTIPTFTLSGTLSSEKASVTGLQEYEMDLGETKTINITVTSESGNIKTYKINAYRRKLNQGEYSTKLNKLIVEGYESDLSPKFNPNQLDYLINIFPNVMELNIKTELLDENSKVKIENNKYLKNNTGVITITVTNPYIEETIYKINYIKTTPKSEYNFDYTGSEQEFTAPVTGKYRIELWGAQGGSTSSAKGGKGAYTDGKIILNKNDILYINVGGKGSTSSAGVAGDISGGYNGGGASKGQACCQREFGSGGGATDIRLFSSKKNNSLNSRIMVAAGGGGAFSGSNVGTILTNGGFGGNLIGGDGMQNSQSENQYCYGQGGSQTSGGAITTKCTYSNSVKGGTITGKFGLGGYYETTITPSSGGGAGYYGGSKSGHIASAGGGSSYISGYLGCVAITSEEDITPKEGCTDGTDDVTCSYHYSGLKFTDSEMKAGNEEMPTYDGTSTMTGNTDNGYAKITPVLTSNDNYLSELTSDYGELSPSFDPFVEEYTLTLDKYTSELTLSGTLSDKKSNVIGLDKYELKNGETKTIDIIITSESGEIRTYTITATRENFGENEHTSKLSKLMIESYEDNLNPKFTPLTNEYTIEIPSTEMELNVKTETFDKDATVKIEGNKYIKNINKLIITVSAPNVEDTIYIINYIKVKLESEYNFDYTGDEQEFNVPVAGNYKLETWGAQGGNATDDYIGGYGGYSIGTTILSKSQRVYINVGGAGSINSAGYNGGATGEKIDTTLYGSGGATHISNETGLLKTLDQKQNSLLIVSGGGGGTFYRNDSNKYVNTGSGGSGGGYIGASAYNRYNVGGGYTYERNATGGTQTDGGISGRSHHYKLTSYIYEGQSGTFGQGGIGYAGGPGGGGYYGGAGGGFTGGAGGSGYIGNPLLTDKAMYCYNCEESNEEDTKTVSTTNVSEEPVSEYAKQGNGYAKITPIITSSDNYLSELKSNYGVFNKTFDPTIENYILNLDKYTENFKLSGKLSDENASVIGLGKYKIDNGETKEIDIIVTSETGEIRTYNITAMRDSFGDNEHSSKLKNIEISGYDDVLNPEFNPLVNEYTIEIPSNEITLNIETETFDSEANVEVSGNEFLSNKKGQISITVTEPNVEKTIYIINYKKIIVGKNLFGYTGKEQVYTVPVTGKYKIELWGAQGGDFKELKGGRGSYSTGNIYLNKSQVLYINVGGTGKTGTQAKIDVTEGGYNGGANSYTSRTECGQSTSSGGGATDIRLISQNLNSRIMVAGGGGGSYYEYCSSADYASINGGAGGGINGQTANYVTYNGYSSINPTGGTQTTGGKSIDEWNSTTYTTTYSGAFGKGGTGNNSYSGGGGGYYGGASGTWQPGAGGSSYISGYVGCVAVTSEEDITPKEGCTDGTNDVTCSYHYSGLKFTDSEMKAGNEEMPNYSGTKTMVGNEGNGYAKITAMPLTSNMYLSSLTTDFGMLSPSFSPDVTEYTLTLDKYTTYFNVNAEASDSSSSISGLGKYEVNYGESKRVNIVVTSKSGEIKTYTIDVKRSSVTEDSEHNSRLKSLKIEGYEQLMEPKFHSMITNYNLQVLSTEIDLDVIATPYDSEANVIVTGNKSVGDSGVITLTVTEPNSDDTVYTINYEKKDYVDANADSIIDFTLNNDLPDGNYNITINGSIDGGVTTENVTYPVEIKNFYDNVTYTSSSSSDGIIELGDDTDEYKMLIVKYHKNLTIGEGVTLTANTHTTLIESTNYELTYKKGMYINVAGKLTNNGTISMTARGTYNQEGENVYLYKNRDNTYEYVPALGATGGNSVYLRNAGCVTIGGSAGATGTNRQTGGGGSGGAFNNVSGTVYSGRGGTGTSYSGGSGGGGTTYRGGGGVTGNAGSSSGGAGGNAYSNYYSNTGGYAAGGGAGNPGGSYAGSSCCAKNSGQTGTGGLLIINTDALENTGTINSSGMKGGYGSGASGGSSGGGSINIFYRTLISEGTITSTGGAAVSAGSKGGDGSVTLTQLVLDEEEIKPTLKTLTVDKGTLKPSFDKTTNEYSVTLDSEDSLVNIDATLTNGENTISSGIGEYNIPAGESKHEIIVTSKYGNINTYIIKFYRPASSYKYLKMIKVNGNEIENFDSSILSYEVDVLYDSDVVNFDVVRGRTSQEVYGIGDKSISSGASIHLINVVSEDGNYNVTYTVTINREHSSKLKNLSVEKYDLDIKFSPEVYKYYVDVPSNTISLNVDYEKYDEEATVKVTGNGYIKGNSGVITVNVTEPHSEGTVYTINVIKEGQIEEKEYNYSYTGSYQKFTAPGTAYYKIELWGAKGGYGRRDMSLVYNGGFGAYTSGEIYLEKGQSIYIFVGGAGQNGGSINRYLGGSGGYNGGGKGGDDSNHDFDPDAAGGGGGATDVRLNISSDESATDFDSLKSRIMVAGGGAGGTYCNRGGSGGSLNDVNGYQFGIGQSGFAFYSGSGGGAGGYYGGKTTYSDCGYGYGGTSYVSGCENCKSITEDSNVDNVILSDNNEHYSGYKFENIKMYNGNEKMPSTTSGYTTGNNGNGYARITAIPNKSSNNYLSTLVSDVGSLSPSFDMNTLEYTLVLKANEEKVTIDGTLEDSTATVTGLGEHYVKAPSDKIEVVVTAEDKTKRVYTINTIRELSNNSVPENISISGLVPSLCKINNSYCKLDQKFDKDTHTYNMTVPSRIKELEFTVTKGHYFQNITGDGVVKLNGGENNITIEVTSEDGESISTYTYVIERDMTGNTDISDLKVNLKDSDENITPVDIGFDQTIEEYYFSIPNEYKNVEFEVTLDDSEASYIVKGNENFVVGNNLVQIIVTAKNGEVGIYSFNIYREENSNVFLKTLSVTNGENNLELNPKYIKTINTYSLTVDNLVKTININAESDSETTSVEGLGEKELKVGLNTFEILTTSESGDTGTYTLNITRNKSSDASLRSLSVSEGSLSPEFTSDNLEYSILVNAHTKKLTINTEVNEENANVKIIGNSNFVPSENTVIVRVTAEDGSVRDYKIIVTKEASDNNYLKSLTVDNYNLDFDKEKEEYSLTVENEIDKIKVTGTVEDELSTVSGNGIYRLKTLENEISIKVISESGKERYYKIIINRKQNSNNNLLMINFDKDVILSPSFDKDTLKYTVNVPYSISELSINGVPEVSTTIVNGNGTYKLNVGENIYNLTLTSEDNTEKTYEIKVIRDENDSLDLKYLNVREGKLSPEFNKNVVNYETDVTNDINSLTIDYELDNVNNNVEISGNENFIVGKNEVIIKISNSKGKEKIYKIIVNKEEESNYNLNLSSLSIDRGELIPDFNENNVYYTNEVSYEVNEIKVNATLKDDRCTIKGIGTYNLNVGKNSLYVLVSDPDGKKKTYQILVTRLESDDARIKSMSVYNSTILPTFDKDVYEYSLSTRNNKLDFNIELMNENASYTITGNENFSLGENIVTINVVAANKVNTKEYKVKVNKLPSNNNNLLSLSVKDNELVPVFDKNTSIYKLTVENEINSIEILGQAEDKNAVVDGLGIKDLMVGENILDVVVTSESGNIKKYTIIVTRKGEKENRLSNIYINDNPVENFDKDNNIYDIEVPYETDKVNITADKVSSLSSVEGLGNINLNVGNNTVNIVVTSENGEVNTYTLNITRNEIISALLDDLKVKHYDLSLEFNSEVYEYNLVVDNEITSLDITPILKDKKASYVIKGNSDFLVGMNKVLVEVTSSDGKDKKEYILNVNRQIYSNTYLEYISVSRGLLNPEFDKLTMDYVVNVDNDVDSITIDSEPSNISSTVEGNGVYKLEKGNNLIVLKVTSNIGVTRNYKVNVVREKSNYNLLTSLRVKYDNNIVNLTPSFNSNTNEYSLSVPEGTEEVLIEAETKENAIINGIGNVKLVGGENIVNILVTAENGSTNNYKLVINRPKSSNAYLTSIEPSTGELIPDFTYENTDYEMHFDSSVTMLSFDVTTEDKNARVTGINNKEILDGTSKRQIVVTAEDGTERIYNITLIKDRTDESSLESLEVSGYNFDKDFSSDEFEYNITVPNSKSKITKEEVMATTKDKNAVVSMEDILYLSTKEVNKYKIIVTAQDGFTTSEYVINITREKGSDSSLSELSFNEGVLKENFSPSVTEYNLEVPKTLSWFSKSNVNYKLKDKNATVQMDTIDLSLNKTFNIVVTSEDESSVTTYVIHISYILSDDSRLKSLYVDNYKLSPDFNSYENSYTVDVFEDETFVNINGVVNDENASIIRGTGKLDLEEEKIINDVVVQAEDGTINIYQLTINKVRTKEKYLKNMKVLDLTNTCDNSCRLIPSFKENIFEYSETVLNSVEKVKLNLEKISNNQNINVYFNDILDNSLTYNLNVGTNVFRIEVSNTENEKQEYTLSVRRDRNENNYLKLLKLTNPEHEFTDFEKEKYEYYYDIPNDMDEVSVLAEAENENANIEVKNNKNLSAGNNDVKVIVTAENGATREYIIHVNRSESYNNYLQSLTISSGVIYDLSPKFNKSIMDYKVEVPNTITKVKVEGVVDDETSTLDGVTESELKEGNNKFKLVVTAKTGEKRIYTINIVRMQGSNTFIESLDIKNGEISPEFNKEVTKYDVNVLEDVTSLDMNIKLEDPYAKYDVIGNNKLESGKNVVTIRVTSEDKKRVKTYTLNVNKSLSNNNNLLMIKVNDNPVENFDKNILEYNIKLENDINSVDISSIRESLTSTVTGNGKYSLIEGNNEILLTVTSESGSEKIYKLNIYRKYDNYLKSIITDRGDITPEFDKNILDYKLNVSNNISNITVIGMKSNKESTVIGNDKYDLNVGENKINIKVISKDNEERIYTLTVTRQQSSNNYLKLLSISEGTFDKSFDKNIQNYTALISNEYESVNIDYETEDENAIVKIIGNENLVLGNNQIIVRVSATNGEERDYILNVVKQEKEAFSNYLSSLTVDKGTLTPEFKKEVNEYTVTVPENEDTITVSGVRESIYSEVTGFGKYNLNVGRNEIYIKVISKDKKERTYRIVVYRSESNEARLSNLLFEEGVVMPIFNKNIFEYSMNVTTNTNSLTPLLITTINPNASYEIIGNKNLELGNNEVIIRVTAEDKKTILDYKINVIKEINPIAKLKSLQSNVGELNPVFNKDNKGIYVISVANDVKSIILTGDKEYESSTVTGLGIHTLVEGDNPITVEVISESGNKFSYALNVIREKSSNAYLSNLGVRGYDITPAFDKKVTSYTLDVDSSVNYVNIYANLENPSSVVTGIGNKDLSYGENEFDILVTAANGDTKTYKIVINRPYVESNKIKNLSVNEGSLSPSFDKEIQNYDIYIPYENESLTLNVELEDENSSFEIKGNKNFKVGENKVEIEVTSKSGNKRIYTLYVVRQVASNNYLKNIYVSDGELSPSFDKYQSSYEVNVSNDVKQITVDADLEDKNATLTGNGTYELTRGENIINLIVKSTTNVERVYTIKVIQNLSDNNLLSKLSVSEGILSPTFDSKINEYSVNVSSNIRKITIDGEVSDENSTVLGFGEKSLDNHENLFEIIVTSESGIVNIYRVNIVRDLSSEKGLLTFYPSVGSLDKEYSDNENEYTLNLDSNTSVVNMNITLKDEKATITGDRIIVINSLNSAVIYKITAEDGSMRTITLNIIKKASIEDISIEENNIVIVEGENKKINIETVPAGIETKYIYETENNDVVKIDENGLVTGLKEGTANIVVYPEIDSTIKKNIVVQVLSKTINSETYKIVREEDKYIIGMEEGTTISEFISNIENDSSTLKIYNKDLVEELDYTSVVKTGQIIKLIINGKEYDELLLIVRGDINGDGEVNVTDKTIIKNHILSKEEITDYRKYAADVVEDNEINVSDNTKLGNYVLGKITTLN